MTPMERIFTDKMGNYCFFIGENPFNPYHLCSNLFRRKPRFQDLLMSQIPSRQMPRPIN